MHRAILFTVITLLFSVSLAQQGPLIKSVYFGGGSYYIDAAQRLEIKKFIESVPDPEHYQITISSHTDNIGGVEYNQRLSEMRSRSVIEQMVRHNIEKERILPHNNGQFDPLYDNSTHRGRMANRRVDIIFTPLFL